MKQLNLIFFRIVTAVFSSPLSVVVLMAKAICKKWEATTNYRAGCKWGFKVFRIVLRLRQNYKVFYSVIRLNSIDMMDKLRRFKVSTKMFFHYETVFKHIVLVILRTPLWVADRCWDALITERGNESFSASPCWVVTPKSSGMIAVIRAKLRILTHGSKCLLAILASVCVHRNYYSIVL